MKGAFKLNNKFSAIGVCARVASPNGGGREGAL
jgi:hypothetical protein